MQMHNIPFATTDWSALPREEKSAQAGQAFWRTQQLGDMRVRMVEYTPGYVSDHWCVKGHVLLCLSGELHTELADGAVDRLELGDEVFAIAVVVFSVRDHERRLRRGSVEREMCDPGADQIFGLEHGRSVAEPSAIGETGHDAA